MMQEEYIRKLRHCSNKVWGPIEKQKKLIEGIWYFRSKKTYSNNVYEGFLVDVQKHSYLLPNTSNPLIYEDGCDSKGRQLFVAYSFTEGIGEVLWQIPELRYPYYCLVGAKTNCYGFEQWWKVREQGYYKYLRQKVLEVYPKPVDTITNSVLTITETSKNIVKADDRFIHIGDIVSTLDLNIEFKKDSKVKTLYVIGNIMVTGSIKSNIDLLVAGDVVTTKGSCIVNGNFTVLGKLLVDDKLKCKKEISVDKDIFVRNAIDTGNDIYTKGNLKVERGYIHTAGNIYAKGLSALLEVVSDKDIVIQSDIEVNGNVVGRNVKSRIV